MKVNRSSQIRKWLWLFFALVSLTSVAVFLLIYREVIAFNSIMAHSAAAGSSGLLAQWTEIQVRLLLLLSGGVMVIGLMGFFWLRIAWMRLNRPIRLIDKAVSRLAAGKLNVTVSIDSADEFGKIGTGLNELAANLQELLLFIWKQSGQCIATLEKMKAQSEAGLSSEPESHQQIFQAIRNLREMAQTYVFYDVRLEGKQALAINEPGQMQSVLDSGE